jgi:hypothetical protein
MNMQNTRTLLTCSRTALLIAACVIGGMNAPALAGGGEHTDFPDLSIGVPPTKGNGGYQAPKKTFDAIVGWVADSEGNMVVDGSLVAPTFPPKPILPEHGYTLEPAASQSSGSVGSNFSAVPAPGVGSLVVVGAAAAGLRRRRRR